MKLLKIFTILIILSANILPAFCDIVNPHLTKEQKEYRQQQLIKRYRQQYIYRHCGLILNDDGKNADKCKNALEKEHEATLKLLEEMVKGNQKYAAKNTENTDN